MNDLLYFDHAASAPRREEVSEAMARWQHGVVGNPSGSHRAAREARRAVEEARDEVASLVGGAPGDVIFTAGGTESCHLAIVGTTSRHRRTHARSEIVVSRVEHHAVLDAAEQMARDVAGVRVRYVEVDGDGVCDLDSLTQQLSEDTAVVSVMAVNNETGVRQPLDGVSAVAHSHLHSDLVTHTDAVAAAPWLSLPVITASVDLVSICAHKLGGPVNSGALIVRHGVGVDPVTPGGGQERGRRGGTLDVAAAVGLASALRATVRDLEEANDRVSELHETLAGASSLMAGCRVTAAGAPRVPGTVHLTFEGLASDEILFLLDQAGVCASAAASCSSGAEVNSHVLAAMGVEPARARGSLRLSMGAETTPDEVDSLISVLAQVVTRLRDQS